MLTSLCSVNILDLYSGNARFKSQQVHLPPWSIFHDFPQYFQSSTSISLQLCRKSNLWSYSFKLVIHQTVWSVCKLRCVGTNRTFRCICSGRWKSTAEKRFYRNQRLTPERPRVFSSSKRIIYSWNPGHFSNSSSIELDPRQSTEAGSVL